MARKKQPVFSVQIEKNVVADFQVRADSIEEALIEAQNLVNEEDLFDTTVKGSAVSYTYDGKVIGVFGG